MTAARFVLYSRVSTEGQGRSGLGLEAQDLANEVYVRSRGGQVLARFVEVETGKGRDALARRPQLRAALEACKRGGAILVIAKLDRLARNVHFVSGLIESGVDFAVADMPSADKFMLHVYAVMAEWERDAISRRTREALAAAKARGVVIGTTWRRNLRPALERRTAEADAFAERVRPVVESCLARGLSQRRIAAELNALGVRGPGGRSWHLTTVQRVLNRLAVRGTTFAPRGDSTPLGTLKVVKGGRPHEGIQTSR